MIYVLFFGSVSMRSRYIFAILVVFLVPLTGCIENSEPEIVGDWYFGENLVLIFERDGTVIGNENESNELNGNWQINDGMLVVDWNDETVEGSGEVSFEVNGSWLFFGSEDSDCVILSRVSVDNNSWYDEVESLTHPPFCNYEAK
tara:strand:- start:177 stop:611 length:435 start_codon:yes stop_codon:yes gene_type:complete